MSRDDSFFQLVAGLQAGDQAAAAEVFNRFTNRLIGLARSRLEQRLRQKVDPEDVVQSAYKSFFAGQAAGRLAPHSWDSLWGILTIITVRKCADWAEHFHTARRDLGREVPAGAGGDDSAAGFPVFAREPTPAEAAALADTVAAMLAEMDERDRAILTLSLQGFGVGEISTELHRSERTVYRVLQRVKKKLESQVATT